ncbi:MAG TPA: ATP-binding cassette domain-containing protein [Solirubrobacteraceae bacterium]|nr:ATP-binding cassette domain-containing protein [Solirubrobacteraceae bacterium]
MSHIRAEGVGVQFLFDRQQRTMSPMLARFRRRSSEHWALTDVSFEMTAGEGVALLGASGSGKSTLLRIIAGVLEPDAGQIAVSGRVGSLLSIQAGVMAALTGRENTYLLGVLAGMTARQARAQIPEVKARSRLEDQYEHLVGSYSQGMRARLGLAVIEGTEPSILLLDEVHEALDHEFRDHVEAYAHRLLEAGGLVVATGHDHPMLERLCTRALLLEDGHVTADGGFLDVQRRYLGDRAA